MTRVHSALCRIVSLCRVKHSDTSVAQPLTKDKTYGKTETTSNRSVISATGLSVVIIITYSSTLKPGFHYPS